LRALTGSPNGLSGRLPSIWARSPLVALKRMITERLTLALVQLRPPVAR